MAVWQEDSRRASLAAKDVGCFVLPDGHSSADANNFFPADTDGLGLGDHCLIYSASIKQLMAVLLMFL